ncbi:hypothetical protein WA158_008338 [Blastocystis sp. Blastoise]
MQAVNILNINVFNNPAVFTSPFQFEILFESLKDLRSDLEWKLTYITNPESQDDDQILDILTVGPVTKGTHKFYLQADPPDPSNIPQEHLLGPTAIIITCSYNDQQFFRVGYYLNNELTHHGNISSYENIERNILYDQPRIVRFMITWDD